MEGFLFLSRLYGGELCHEAVDFYFKFLSRLYGGERNVPLKI